MRSGIINAVRVLIIEDDTHLAKEIKFGLEENGYAVDWVIDGESGLDMGQAYPYDLIILDIVIPKKDGFDVCRGLRGKRVTTPILMLTARYREGDKVRGLDSGADDYLAKPFSYPELYARIRALLRRINNCTASIVTIGNYTLDMSRNKFLYHDKEFHLSAKEYAIVEYLILNRNGIVTQRMIEDHVWDCDHGAFSNVIEVLISRIRKKLCNSDKEALIKTVKGLGYIIEDK